MARARARARVRVKVRLAWFPAARRRGRLRRRRLQHRSRRCGCRLEGPKRGSSWCTRVCTWNVGRGCERVPPTRPKEHGVWASFPVDSPGGHRVCAPARGYYLAVHDARRRPLRAVCPTRLTVRCRESLTLLPVPCCRRDQRRRCGLLHRLLRGGP